MLEVRVTPPANDARSAAVRPAVGGKFLFVGREKLYVRGVTYGPFRPGPDGEQYGSPQVVHGDFARMAASGINCVRTYTVPPRWLLDCAQQFGLRVLVGTAWEQHVAFLEERARAKDIERRVRKGVRACADHPAVVGYAIGNEIPASLVRWYGSRRTEGFLKRLYDAAKDADPGGLVTYLNYPTTEYLELPFLDFVGFNVYLESEEQLRSYLPRLHNLAGDRPLVMGEIGLDSRTHGGLGQARALSWQIRTVFESGCAGSFVFAWTDEWHRGGQEVEGWDFGLVDRDRNSKPALAAVVREYAHVPLPSAPSDPRISVVVCTYNGESTLRECLQGVARLEYPDYEVIVVDDGSTDSTFAIASEFDVKLIQTTNRGLSYARNLGRSAATGEIIAYLDDDAYPDPHWLTYLAAAFSTTSHAGIGGPNIPPPGDGLIAECVANAPGGPTHVLLSDCEAEHIPGCNMAFRKSCLDLVGGFDPQFRVAGDDVDLCWRLQARGWTLGFSPAAMVWHHRRNSIGAYWKQQKGYGRAEALLEAKWPAKYNSLGHVAWRGRVYGDANAGRPLFFRGRIYQGTWGSALFQSVYQPRPATLAMLPLMPEWYLVIVGLGALSMLGANWSPILAIASLATPACAALLVQAAMLAARSHCRDASSGVWPRWQRWALTTLLYLLQPLARLVGRIGSGLTPWRQRSVRGAPIAWRSVISLWSDRWRSAEEWLHALEGRLRQRGLVVRRGGDFDPWDLEVRTGALGAVRMRLGIEEHGEGRQFLRMRWWPRLSVARVGLILGVAALAVAAIGDRAWVAGTVLGGVAILLIFRKLQELGISASGLVDSMRAIDEPMLEAVAAEDILPDLSTPAGTSRRIEIAPATEVRLAAAESVANAGRVGWPSAGGSH